jgi:hypothetical protein
MGDAKRKNRALSEWLTGLADKVEFEQRMIGSDLREIRIVIPTFPGVPIKDYVVKGEEARNKIAKFTLAMAAGYCRMVGAPKLEEVLFSIGELVTGQCRAEWDGYSQ